MGRKCACCLLHLGVLLALQVGLQSVHAAPTNLGIAFGDVKALSIQPLPRATAINIIKNSMKISNIRLYEDITTDQSALQAILDATVGSSWQPKVTVTVPNERIADLANGNYADSFTKVLAKYTSIVAAVAVSNEPDTCCQSGTRCGVGRCTDPDVAGYLSLTKKAVDSMVLALGSSLQTRQIVVTVPFSQTVLNGCFPPSNCTVRSQLQPGVSSILQAIKGQGSAAYVMANIYPSSAWQDSNPAYVLGVPGAPKVVDNSPSGVFTYTSMFDAMYDSVRVAFNGLGDFQQLPIVVGETGWPSAGGDPNIANISNACTYNNYLTRYIKAGSHPPRENSGITVFLFEAFDELLKPGSGIEKYWGVYNESGTAKYIINWEGTGSGAPACDSSIVTEPPADLSVKMYASPAAPQPGETFTYTIRVTATAKAVVSSAGDDGGVAVSHIYLPVIPDPADNGDGPKNVRLVDTLPAGLNFVYVSPYYACRYKDSSRIISCRWSVIAEGSSQLVRITVRAPPTPGKYENTATVYADSVPNGVSSRVEVQAMCVPAGSSCRPSYNGASNPCCSGTCTRQSWSPACREGGRSCYRPYVCQ